MMNTNHAQYDESSYKEAIAKIEAIENRQEKIGAIADIVMSAATPDGTPAYEIVESTQTLLGFFNCILYREGTVKDEELSRINYLLAEYQSVCNLDLIEESFLLAIQHAIAGEASLALEYAADGIAFYSAANDSEPKRGESVQEYIDEARLAQLQTILEYLNTADSPETPTA